jgi:hypothetical protein
LSGGEEGEEDVREMRLDDNQFIDEVETMYHDAEDEIRKSVLGMNGGSP